MSKFLSVPSISESCFWSFRGTSCLANNYRLHLYRQLFYDAFFQHRLVRNDGVDDVCHNSFLRRGQVNSVLCVLCRSSMNFIIYLPRLLDICSCFYFVCIAVGEEHYLMSFFTFFFFCHQSSLCNIILISCLIHMVDSVSLPCVSPSLCDTPFVMNHSVSHLCIESSRNSSVSKELLSPLNVLGSHEYRLVLHIHLCRFS